MKTSLLFGLAVLVCGVSSLAGQVDSQGSETSRLAATVGRPDEGQSSARPNSLQSKDYLIWDPDPTSTSGPAIDLTLLNNRYSGDYATNITSYLGSLSEYSSVWICLGVMPNNYVLEDTLGTRKDSLTVDSLISYLVTHNGAIYLEGGDTWAWDSPTRLHPYFNITGEFDGWNAAGILGRAGTFTDGMDFDYTGEDNVLDDIAPSGTAILTLVKRENASHGMGVAYDHGAGLYKTVGFSFEFGGLVDGTEPSTKATLADSVMHFFGIFPPPPPDWDVGIFSIGNPDTPYVEPWVGLNPSATVKNWGLNPATFDAWCEVDSEGVTVYQSSQPVGPLDPNLTQPVTFPLWSPDGPGNYYTFTFYTQLAGDQNPDNDSASTAVTTSKLFGTVVDSVKLSGLPPNTLAGITYCEMDSMFYFVSSVEEYVYRLDPNTWSYEQAFPTANAGSEDPWGISWDGDYFWVEQYGPSFAYFYDRQYSYPGSPTGYFCDVGSLIGGRAAGLDWDRKYMRQAKWSSDNGIYRLDAYGSALLDFIIGPWSASSQTACAYIPYTHEILTGGNVSNYFYKVDAQDGSQLKAAPMPDMADLDIQDLGITGVDSLYAYMTKTDPENTIYKVAIEFRRLDLDLVAISIDVPADTVAGRTPILASVANWGRVDQVDVWVYCSATPGDSVSPEFEDSAQVSLVAGQESQVAFPDTWITQQSGIDYELAVETHLPADQNSYNDSVTKWVYSLPLVHDCGVDSIISPPDTVRPDSTYVPRAWVRNYGNVPESLEVFCTIDGYQDTVSVAHLGRDSALACMFSPWAVPSPDSATYLMTVATRVAGDGNTSNDTLTKSIFALRVGIEEVINSQFPVSDFRLYRSYPNPFCHATTVTYSLPPRRGDAETRSPEPYGSGRRGGDLSTYQLVNLSIYDLTGRLVKTLVDEIQLPGHYSVVWDGKDELGVRVASGVYFCRLWASEGGDPTDLISTKKVAVLR